MGQYVPSGLGLEQEMKNIAEALQTPNEGIYLGTLYVAPKKPREGMIVLADGVNFNPGSGSGFYGFRAGAWRFLG